jgi:hypothetical protein
MSLKLRMHYRLPACLQYADFRQCYGRYDWVPPVPHTLPRQKEGCAGTFCKYFEEKYQILLIMQSKITIEFVATITLKEVCIPLFTPLLENFILIQNPAHMASQTLEAEKVTLFLLKAIAVNLGMAECSPVEVGIKSFF